ncbi:hypothetical protein BYT27DRAFT_7253620 [Phlegmacium glaucopus]|nr:hypothetical protein BYT27DRAFT_7253620 [Phlegmacium glaucopus]
MEPGDHMTSEELERIRRSAIDHAAAAAHHTPIANGPGHNSAPPTAHPHCPTCGRISPRCRSRPQRCCTRRSYSKDYGPVQGVVIVQLKDVIDTMKDNFQRTRVSGVGTEGQALVIDVEGTDRELTVRSIAKVTKAVALGYLSERIEVDARDGILDPKNTLNGMMIRLRALAVGVVQVTLRVGSKGKLGGQVHVSDAEGSVVVLGAERQSNVGDLTQKIEISVQGEMSTLKGTVNPMVDHLSAFASEVTRVALEVGTQGILGGQARVESVQGTLADLTRNVNKMASNLTDQVSSTLMFEEMLDLKMSVNSMVARLSALANKITRVSLEVGTEEILELEGIVNGMTESLSVFADEVTRVARAVGTEGQLGGQARFTNVSGTWKDLTNNVNLMTNNLTLQARTIAVLEYTLCTTGGTRSGFDF